MTAHEGHRHRLRKQFLAGPDKFSESQLLELLLMYAIPRQDVAPIAAKLVKAHGSLEQLLSASYEELVTQEGVGEATAIFIRVVRELLQRTNQKGILTVSPQEVTTMELQQQELFSLSPRPEGGQVSSPKPPPPPPTKSDIRAYNNDLTKVALKHLPAVVEYNNFSDFSSYLEENLPYNSGITRTRYSRYLTNRFYPEGTIATPLTELLSFSPDLITWKEILFFETTKAEPAVQFVAEQIVWPALPIGQLERKALSEKLRKRFAEASEATIKRMVYSLVNLYTLLDVATLEDDRLIFRNRIGSLSAFTYGLVSEFPEPGIYAFEAIENGPMRHWLLWDKEWMRRQLYNLRDLGIVAKISEIDAVRQFTLSTDQLSIIKQYFEHPKRQELALRESPMLLGDES